MTYTHTCYCVYEEKWEIITTFDVLSNQNKSE